MVAALHISVEALANLIPGVDVAADVAMAAKIAQTAFEYRQLAIDAAAAFDFVKKGPHSLEDLQVSSGDYEEFSNYGQFIKGELSLTRWSNDSAVRAMAINTITSSRKAARTQTTFRHSSCRTPTT